ncbi:GlcG/HbpS family heme-binding protein [Halomonas dongshanensis]|uniref:Heme-binding protein n=1 Tax=Halomonas dongshanensis TaxID=2890835 RepID=A0ABT2EFW2_9GAMM|nr:heme-binding protein [Halomonas dongshanensis]MCS2610374.1 heme-binding protein [Halomonas dongshanensis]
MSERINTCHNVSSQGAHAIIEATVKAAKQREIPVSIAVVDRGGWLIEFHRMDGGVAGGVDGAIRKAISAAKFEEPLAKFSKMAAEEQDYIGNMPGLIPLGGAEPLKIESKTVGAVAVSGAYESLEQELAEIAVAAFDKE